MNNAKSHRPDLEAIFRECARDLNAYFTRRHGTTDQSDDLVQESFLQLARRLRSDDRLVSPRAYLFGIARHISWAFRRKQARAAELLEIVPREIAESRMDERLEAARETMASLPPLQREILDLRFAHDLSYAEIAVALGVPVGTVRSRLHHAITLLRQKLEADDKDGATSASFRSAQNLATNET